MLLNILKSPQEWTTDVLMNILCNWMTDRWMDKPADGWWWSSSSSAFYAIEAKALKIVLKTTFWWPNLLFHSMSPTVARIIDFQQNLKQDFLTIQVSHHHHHHHHHHSNHHHHHHLQYPIIIIIIIYNILSSSSSSSPSYRHARQSNRTTHTSGVFCSANATGYRVLWCGVVITEIQSMQSLLRRTQNW